MISKENNSLPEPIITLNNVSKIYSMGETTVTALNNVSTSFNKGEFTAIMGASGSGKSTLMNIVGCLDTPTKGTYRFEKTEVHNLNRNQLAALRNRKMGFVFQTFNLLPRTTALENIELPLQYDRTIPSSQIKKRASEALDRVGLSSRASHYPNQLSGGQQQRIAIARAIVTNPAVLLADEPTGNLDSAMSIEIMTLFQDLNKNGITIIMVTHENDIAAFTKRKIRFKDGFITTDENMHKSSVNLELTQHIKSATQEKI